jgi:hypothetical protein
MKLKSVNLTPEKSAFRDISGFDLFLNGGRGTEKSTLESSAPKRHSKRMFGIGGSC